jgi:hypothetical protein
MASETLNGRHRHRKDAVFISQSIYATQHWLLLIFVIRSRDVRRYAERKVIAREPGEL